jgi:hypothetical protein
MTLIVSWLWQGLAIAWITAAAVRAMPRLSAATRYAVWWLALGAVLAIPVAHGIAGITVAAPPIPDATRYRRRRWRCVDADGNPWRHRGRSGRHLGDDSRRVGVEDRGELPCPRAAETHLVAIRPVARGAPGAVGRRSRQRPPGPPGAAASPGGRTSKLRLRDWSVRARIRPAGHPRIALCG